MIRKYDPDAFHNHPNPIIRFIETKRVQTILEMVGNTGEEDRVLEVGCGAANIIEKVQGEMLFGVDISNYILAKASQRLTEKVVLFQADALNLPFKNGTFKQIICSEVLEHLLDPMVALKETARVLKTGGVALVSVPNESVINLVKRILIRLGIFKWLFQRKGSYPEMPERMNDEWHLHTFILKEWLDLFGALFGIVQVKRIPFFWIPLRYVVRLEKK